MHKTIPHNRLTFDRKEIEAVTAVVESGFWAGGPKVQELELYLAKLVEATYSVAVASGSAALKLGLKALSVQQGDEVVVPAYSCVALANAVLASGAMPKPVDISVLDYNIDPTKIEAVVSKKTKAIIVVNTFGLPAPISEIRDFGLPIIEDCSHGFATKSNDEYLGNRATIAIISFYATKLIGGGEGGAILTNQQSLAEFIRQNRDYTDQQPSAWRSNDKMNDLEAALALCQAKKMLTLIADRQRAADYYFQFLQNIDPKIQSMFTLPRENNRIWYRYCLMLNDSLSAASVSEKMKLNGVYAELPISPWLGLENYPVAQKAYGQLLSLPLYPTITPDEQQFVVQTLENVLKSEKNK